MGDLKTLKTITAFCFFSDNVKYWISKLSSFCVMSFGPVITCTWLTKDEIIGSKKLTERTGTNWVHSPWFKVHQDCSWDISASCCLIEVNIYSFKLEIRVSMISTGRINTMFIRNDFPELGTNLVTTLTCLYVNNLSHFWLSYKVLIKIVNRKFIV
jgi:hypothetical protein